MHVPNRAVRLYHDRLPATSPLAIPNGLTISGSSASMPRRAQALSEDKIRQIIRATEQVDRVHGWQGDLLRFVLVLAATGARFSQVSRLTVWRPAFRPLEKAELSSRGSESHCTSVRTCSRHSAQWWSSAMKASRYWSGGGGSKFLRPNGSRCGGGPGNRLAN
jgi:hypothetical protein